VKVAIIQGNIFENWWGEVFHNNIHWLWFSRS